MKCAWSKLSSHTFRLPENLQSETIPRCLKAAASGPTLGNAARRASGATSAI